MKIISYIYQICMIWQKWYPNQT